MMLFVVLPTSLAPPLSYAVAMEPRPLPSPLLITPGIPDTLHALLKDSSWVTRAKAAEVLTILASHSVGRAAVLEGEMVPTLASLVCVCLSVCVCVHVCMYGHLRVCSVCSSYVTTGDCVVLHHKPTMYCHILYECPKYKPYHYVCKDMRATFTNGSSPIRKDKWATFTNGSSPSYCKPIEVHVTGNRSLFASCVANTSQPQTLTD